VNYYERSAQRIQAVLAKYKLDNPGLEAEQMKRERQARDLQTATTRSRRLNRLPLTHATTAAQLLTGQAKPWPVQVETTAAHQQNRSSSILLTGPTELGKSTALVALAIREINAGRDARYVATGRAGAVLMGKDKFNTWADLENCPALVLDELHRLPALSPKIATAVAALIDHRWSWGRPTWSAATCSLELLAKGIRWELCRRYQVRIPDNYTPTRST
jgi:DNA replication protein DnaC